METIKIETLKQAAKQLLLDPSTDPLYVEYLRGICELIAEVDGIENMATGDRAIEIAVGLNMPDEVINKMY